MDIQEARELIGESNSKYSDEQILKMAKLMDTIIDLIIDKFLKMTPEERKRISEKSKP